MLKIREAQTDALRLAAYGRFRERALAHVQKHFPNHVRVAGDEAIAATVDTILERGAAHGMGTERTALLYLTTGMMLGSGFDTSPAFPWAAEILAADRRSVDRARDLAYTALDYQKRIAGPNNASLNRAFLNLARRFDAFAGPAAPPGFDAGPAAGLEALHPQRAEALGPERMALLERVATEKAAAYGLVGAAGSALYGVAMFFIGWEPEQEPFTPWVREALTSPDPEGGPARQAALHAAAAAFLGRWLEHTGRTQ